MTSNKDDKDHSESIAIKIMQRLDTLNERLDSSAVMNGGFDSLHTKIDLLDSSINNLGIEVKDIKIALYEPEKGVFAKLKSLELNTKHSETELQDNTQKLSALKAFEDDSKTIQSLKKIAGDNLQDLEKIFKIANAINKLYWLLAAGVVGAVGKFLWELIIKHHM
jgi:hypothetical protein